LLRLFLIRVLLFAIPFAAYFVWRAVRRRSGRAVGAVPWLWLVAAGAMVTAVSLIVPAAFHSGGTGQYVPAQVRPDGTVVPGHYEERKAPVR
jgi:hypothetical protein